MVVYIIRNSKNEKVYIGQTKTKLKIRLKRHVYSATVQFKKNKFHTAIRENGESNFYIEPLHFCKTPDEMNEMEKYYIGKYNSVEEGYNDQHGGIGGQLTKHVREQLSKIRKGENNPFYNSKHSEASKVKMKIKRTGKRPNLRYTGKDLDGIKFLWMRGVKYESISKRFGISIGRISQLAQSNNWVKIKGGEE